MMETRNVKKKMMMQRNSEKQIDKWTKGQKDTFVRKSNHILPRDIIVNAQLNKIKVEAVDGEEHAELTDTVKQEASAGSLPFVTPDNQDTLSLVAEASFINDNSHQESITTISFEEPSDNIHMEEMSVSSALTKTEEYVTHVTSEIDIDEAEYLQIKRVESVVLLPQGDAISDFISEIEKLKRLLKSKEDENVAFTEEIKQLKSKTLTNTLEDPSGDSSDIDLSAENRRLWGKIEKCTEENVELKKKNLEQQTEIQALEKSMSLSRERVHRLTTDLASKEKSLHEIKVEMEQVKKNLEEMQKSLKERDEDNVKLRTNMHKFQVDTLNKYFETDRRNREEAYKQLMESLGSQSSDKQLHEEEATSSMGQDPSQIIKSKPTTHSSDKEKAGSCAPPIFPTKLPAVITGRPTMRRKGNTTYRKYTAKITPRIRKVSAVVKQVQVTKAFHISPNNPTSSNANSILSTSVSECENAVGNCGSSGRIEDVSMECCNTNENCIPSPAREITASLENGVCNELNDLFTDNSENQVFPDLCRDISDKLPVSEETSGRASTSPKRSFPIEPNTPSCRSTSSRIGKRQKINKQMQTLDDQNQLNNSVMKNNNVNVTPRNPKVSAVVKQVQVIEASNISTCNHITSEANSKNTSTASETQQSIPSASVGSCGIFAGGSHSSGSAENATVDICLANDNCTPFPVREMSNLSDHGVTIQTTTLSAECIERQLSPEMIKCLIEEVGMQVDVKDNYGEMLIHQVCYVKQNFKEMLDVLLAHDVAINATNNNGDTVLGLAAWNGRSKEDIQYIISKGGDWEAKNLKGLSILHLAVSGGNPEVIKYLVEEIGMEIHAKDNFGQMPVHKICFVKQNFKETLDALLAYGADINATDKCGGTVLSLAAWKGRPKEIVEYIISKGGDWKATDLRGLSVLHLAVWGGNPEVIKYLIEEIGMKIHAKDNFGQMPVHKICLVKQNFKETLDVLLAHGIAINATDKNGDTVLVLAALAGRSKEDLEYIISRGGDWKAKDLKGLSVLHCAAEGGNPEAIKYLIDLGASANFNFKNRTGKRILHAVAFTKLDFKGSLDAFLDRGTDINEPDDDGNILLSWATFNGRSRADLEYIVEKGGDWKRKNKNEQTVLYMAAERGNMEAIKYFISLGVPIDSKDNVGRLALHDIVENRKNFNETLDVLLEHGACINSVENNGDSLLGIAALYGREKKVLEYIVQKGANWGKKNKDGRSVLHLAAFGGNVESLKYLIALGGKIHQIDNEGHTPMQLLGYIKENFKECLDTFLEHGAKINVINKVGHTLLDIARKEKMGFEELEYIISKGGTGKENVKQFG